MLHAFLPHKFVDHTHATAVLSVIDQPDGEKRCAEVFGGRLAFVPYLMPGFGLAKKAIEVFERAKPSDGLILGKHGIVTFGESAREAYERMIEMVSLAENFIAAQPQIRRRRPRAARNRAALAAGRADRARRLQPEGRKQSKAPGAGLCSIFAPATPCLNFLECKDLDALSEGGVVTPDHTIRTKNWPLVLPPPRPANWTTSPARRAKRREQFADALSRLFRAQQQTRRRQQAGTRSPAPRRPGARARPVRPRPHQAGRRHRRRHRRAEWIDGRQRRRSHRPLRVDPRSRHVRLRILAAGTGQARQRKEPPLAGQIAAVTGAARRDRRRHGQGFCRGGRRSRAARRQSCRRRASRPKPIGPTALPVACDVTDAASVRAAFDRVADAFRRRRYRRLQCRRGLAGPHRRGRRSDSAQKLRAEFLRPSARGAGRGEHHAGARHRRLPAVQRLQAGGQSGPEFRPLRHAQGGDAVR